MSSITLFGIRKRVRAAQGSAGIMGVLVFCTADFPSMGWRRDPIRDVHRLRHAAADACGSLGRNDGCPGFQTSAALGMLRRVRAAQRKSWVSWFLLVSAGFCYRVFAVGIPGFNRAYGGAELSMHFSLTDEMTPLQRFLAIIREKGVQGITAELERGTV